jgi:hypothetical protein
MANPPSSIPLALPALLRRAQPPAQPSSAPDAAENWTNVPRVIRQGLVDCSSSIAQLSAELGELIPAINRRAGHAEVTAALSRCASLEALQELGRRVQEASSRAHSPCAANAATSSAVAAILQRVEQLEHTVSAQDEALKVTLAELSALRNSAHAASLNDANSLKSSLPAFLEAAARESRAIAESVFHKKADAEALHSLSAATSALRERLLGVAKVVESQNAGLDAVRARLFSVEASATELREGGGNELAQSRARLSLQSTVSAVVEQHLVGKMANMRRATDALIRGAKEKLSAELFASLEAAVDKIKGDVEGELRKAKAARGESARALSALAASSAQPPAREETRVPASVKAAIEGAAEEATRAARRVASEGVSALSHSLQRLEEKCELSDARFAQIVAKLKQVQEEAERANVSAQQATEGTAAAARRQTERLEHAIEECRAELAAIESKHAPHTPPPPAEEIRGRWVWRNRPESAPATGIHFDLAALNTAPSLLRWKPGGSVIEAVRQGLYKVAVGFYSTPPPTVTLLVDSSPVLTLYPPPTEGDSERQSALLMLHSHPAGTVCGVSGIHFLSLPEGAHFSVSFLGPSKAQGFVELCKV